jgi:uncharacterized membrane protein
MALPSIPAAGVPLASAVRPALAADAADPMPLGVAWLLGLVLLATGGLLAWVGVRAAGGRLARNERIGLRTPRTLGSDAAWDAAHRVAGRWLVAAAAAVAVPGLVLFARPTNALGSLLVLVGSGLLVSLVAVAAILGDRAAADP